MANTASGSASYRAVGAGLCSEGDDAVAVDGPYSRNGVQIWSMVYRLVARPKHQSFFLFGARGTGKSTWLR